jgi:hypothetical protein
LIIDVKGIQDAQCGQIKIIHFHVPFHLASMNGALYIVQARMGLLHMNYQYRETETNLKGNKENKGGGATIRNGGTPVYIALLTTIMAQSLMRTSSNRTLAFSSAHHIVFHASPY